MSTATVNSTNAGADNLSGDDYAQMAKVFSATAQTTASWNAFYAQLRGHGTVDGLVTQPRSIAKNLLRLQPSDSLSGEIAQVLGAPRNRNAGLAHPQPVAYNTFRRWEPQDPPITRFDNPDPGMRYFQGMALIAQMQRLHGGQLFFYHSPQFDHRADRVYVDGVTQEFARYLEAQGIAHTSLIDMPLAPITETYDGVHQTLYGNRKIAATLLERMLAQGVIR